jgi:N-acetylmuramoyl-L-alanine amidase
MASGSCKKLDRLPRRESDKQVDAPGQTFRHVTRLSRVLPAACFCGLVLLLWSSRTLRSDNFVFYLPTARSVIPLETIDGNKYLPLISILNTVGKVGALQEKRDSLKLWFGETQIEVRADDKKVRVNKSRLDLAGPVRRPKGQWLVPVDFLTTVLPRLTSETVEYQTGTNRVFIGDVRPISFTVRLDRTANGARVTVQFTDKVTMRTAASNGKWYLFLGGRPVEPLEQVFHFQDPYISELRFDDQDGAPKLILTPATGGLDLYPALAEGGKVLLADVLKPPPAPPQPAAVEQPMVATGSPQPAPAAAGGEELPAGPPLPVVVLDAAHGGTDVGARSRDGVLEKDLVAQIVARVRASLLAARKFRVVLTRVGDVNLTFEQRETAANLHRPYAFLTFHAGNLGVRTPRIVVYSYQAGSPAELHDNSEPRPLLVLWNKVYEVHLDQSRQLARVLQQKFAALPGLTTDEPQEAPVRGLRSVDAPAVAIEIGTLTPEADAGTLTDPSFQQQIANVAAAALDTWRGGTL